MPADKILRLAAEVRKTARPTGAKVLINDRVDVALAADLDGVHLPEGGLPVKDARRLLGDAPLLGISAHGLERVLQGAGEGADFCVAGPLSESASKEKGHWIMPERIFEEICARSPIPVFALGGVGLEDISRWMDLGAYGIAGISLWLSPDSRDNIFTVIQKTLGSL